MFAFNKTQKNIGLQLRLSCCVGCRWKVCVCVCVKWKSATCSYLKWLDDKTMFTFPLFIILYSDLTPPKKCVLTYVPLWELLNITKKSCSLYISEGWQLTEKSQTQYTYPSRWLDTADSYVHMHNYSICHSCNLLIIVFAFVLCRSGCITVKKTRQKLSKPWQKTWLHTVAWIKCKLIKAII